MDALEIVLDEVALEGLDGITVSSLWIRLKNRQPPFPRSLDPMSREYVWRFLVSSHDEVSFYLLPQDRPPITSYDRLDSGKIHYLRKSLDRNGLITLQSHVVRLPSGAQKHSILLLLKRFHVDRRSKYDILMEATSNILSELPHNTGIMIKLRDQLHICERTFKKMYQYMQAAKMVSVVFVPLQELNPDAGPCKTKRGTDIQVRCLKLIKPYKKNPIDDDDEDDENNDDDGDVAVRRNVQAHARDIERDLLAQAYDIVNNAWSLWGDWLVQWCQQDQKRTTKYISKLFVAKSKLNLDFTKEKERSEKLRAPQEDTPTRILEDMPTPGLDTQADSQEEEVPTKGERAKNKSVRKSKSAPKIQQKEVTESPLRHSTPMRKKQPAPPTVKGKSFLGAELSEVEEKDYSLINPDTTADHTPSIINDQSQRGEESAMVFEEFGAKPEVEFIVHPSVTPDDPLVRSAIEQVRFKISSSYTVHRKYFFSFYESLQKLCYMGLLQFGPNEKFMDKDQAFFFLKKRATLVDTTVCEPHYNKAIESRPFERRHYTFNTLLDVENYWFDLMCVCLSTPLGVIRPRNHNADGDAAREEAEPESTSGKITYESLQYTLKGSCEVVDDGVTPGDGQGAGGLDSTFYSHLKRNWLWTGHLLMKPKKNVKLGVEPSSRNQQVRGGKKQKRKRQKKEIVKPPKKKRKFRDILHRDLELSLDKTSLAVGRRSRYIMKNPQTQLNFRICLAEVYQDKALIDEFINRTNNYTEPSVCAEEFNEFVSALRTKFSSSCGSSEVQLPDTKEELFSKFKVYIIGDEAVRTSDVLNRYFSWRFPGTLSNDIIDLLEALGRKGRVDRPNTFSFQTERVRDEGEQESEGGKEKGEDKCLAPASDVEDMLMFSMDSAGGATVCCLTLLTLGLMSVDISIPQQIVVVDSTLVDNEVVKSLTKELDEEEEDEGGARLEVKAHQASHTNFLLMKGYFVPGIISLRNITSTEHIAVNACSLRIRLRNTQTHTLFAPTDGTLFSTPSLPSFISHMIDWQGVRAQDFLEKCVCALGYSSEDVEAVKEVMLAVEMEKEFGIDLHDLYRKFTNLEQVGRGRSKTLQQYIQDLLDCEKVLEVGALSARLVSMDFAFPWLLQCPKVLEVPGPITQKASPPPTTTDIPPKAPTTSRLTPEALPLSQKPPLKRPLDQQDEDHIVPPVKRPTMETVATEAERSNAEVGGVTTSPDAPTSDTAAALRMCDSSNKEDNMAHTQGGENAVSTEEDEE
ncbi:General transcription factor 3C polypeptide 1 [Bagarius yarrelli]|uniref:General transcription factor 3C polypeptide 1 n=1 Tax=Bagarius yarrelli TaxID=175774 RepID=A0A556VAS5_BAGYA|nr:General transcription factor 3C polypeptide 1 [Bagarius yarrelli]